VGILVKFEPGTPLRLSFSLRRFQSLFACVFGRFFQWVGLLGRFGEGSSSYSFVIGLVPSFFIKTCGEDFWLTLLTFFSAGPWNPGSSSVVIVHDGDFFFFSLGFFVCFP